jgi:hypothetical protein
MNDPSILTKFHIDLLQVKRSSSWYADQIKIMKTGRITAKKLITTETDKLTRRITPGSLYFFFYDPKLKDILPHYDMFPMVFPYKPVPGGFLGLNLHYLGYPERFALFRELLKINGGKIHETTKIKYSWGVINNMSRMRGAEHCIKHYLYEHVRSPFLKVPPADWATSMMLPVEKFVGTTKEKVWQQTRKR